MLLLQLSFRVHPLRQYGSRICKCRDHESYPGDGSDHGSQHRYYGDRMAGIQCRVAKALSPANIAPVAVMIGVIVMLTGKRRSTKDISSIIVGFGILFIGITTMSDAVEPLQQSEAFCNLFVTLGHSPFLGIVAGALVTAVIQSSSASVGILQSLAAAGLVPFNAAVYIIMGQNIGTCVTASCPVSGQRRQQRQQL